MQRARLDGRVANSDLQRIVLGCARKAAAASSLHHSVTTSHSSPWRAVVRRRKPGRFGTSSVWSRLSRARNDSSLTPSASRNVVTSTTDIAQAWTSMSGLPSGSVMAARVGPPGTSKGSATMVAPRETDWSSDARRSATWT